MKKLTLLSLFLSLGLLMGADRAQAQAQIQVGPRIGYELSDFEALFVGADVRISTPALPVQINPTLDYYFLEDTEIFGTEISQSLLQLTVNALYQFGINNEVFTPYAGGGLSYLRISAEANGESSSDSDVGLNLVGGAEFGVGQLKAFAQAEFVVGGDANPLKITGGVLFGF